MKAISLWEPWGTAIAKCLKKIETRSWPAKYRGPLAIHCSQKRDMAYGIVHDDLRQYFEPAGITEISQLSFGCIVAVCKLTDCLPTETLLSAGLVSPMERAFGDYGKGRWGWILEDVKPLAKPVFYRGAQGFFTVPDSLLDGSDPGDFLGGL